MPAYRFGEYAINILSEELDRRIEAWNDVLVQMYGNRFPTNDPAYDELIERMHLLLMLKANLDTIELVNDCYIPTK
jgi:hypothetical protein